MNQYTYDQVRGVIANMRVDGQATELPLVVDMLRAYAATLRQQAARVDESLWAAVDRMIVDAWKLGGCEKTLDMLAMRSRFDAALSAQPAPERQGGAKPKFFGIACTVAWTELHNAMAADGMNPPTKCGKATRDWIEGIVRDTFTHPAAPVGVPDGWREAFVELLEDYAGARAEVAAWNVTQRAQPEGGVRLPRPRLNALMKHVDSLAAAPTAPQGTDLSQADEARSDSRIVTWLEEMHNLHTTVEVLYVVDGYEVSLCWDGEPLHVFKGETIREAYRNAMVMTYENRRFVERK